MTIAESATVLSTVPGNFLDLRNECLSVLYLRPQSVEEIIEYLTHVIRNLKTFFFALRVNTYAKQVIERTHLNGG
jgi:hypothetical protein